LNQCCTKLNQLTSATNNPLPDTVNNNLQELSKQNITLKKAVAQLGSQIEVLSQNNKTLQNKLNDVISHSQPVRSDPQELSKTATSIVDELAEYDHKAKNLMIYNFPEEHDPETEKANFIKMCNDITNLDEIRLLKFYCIGCKDGGRLRPLLVGFDTENIKLLILSRAPQLRHHQIYNKVYIAPDMTKLECTKHKKLVEELQTRRQQREQNLIIRNGAIITRKPKIHSTPNHFLASSSELPIDLNKNIPDQSNLIQTNVTSLFDNTNLCSPNSKDSHHTLPSNDPQCRNIILKDKSNTQANMQSESLKIICLNCQSIIGKKKYFGNC